MNPQSKILIIAIQDTAEVAAAESTPAELLQLNKNALEILQKFNGKDYWQIEEVIGEEAAKSFLRALNELNFMDLEYLAELNLADYELVSWIWIGGVPEL